MRPRSDEDVDLYIPADLGVGAYGYSVIYMKDRKVKPKRPMGFSATKAKRQQQRRRPR